MNIICPTCERSFPVLGDPLCPTCAVYVPEAFTLLIGTWRTAAKAALKYVDDLNEDTPVDPNCKECVGRVFFNKGTPEPPLCWIHQLKAAVAQQ